MQCPASARTEPLKFSYHFNDTTGFHFCQSIKTYCPVPVDERVPLPYNAIQCPFMGKCMFVTVKLLHGYLCFMKGVTLMATENKMGVMPLNRLLISMSVPMMISMLVQALYNIVDSMFVAQLSENALTAVSLAFPAQNLMIAVATGTGVGVNAALSRNLGEKNFERANRIADHALFLAAMSYIVFALFGLFFARQSPDRYRGDRRSRNYLFKSLYTGFLRTLHGDCLRTSPSVYRKDDLLHVHSGTRCHHQYHS